MGMDMLGGVESSVEGTAINKSAGTWLSEDGSHAVELSSRL